MSDVKITSVQPAPGQQTSAKAQPKPAAGKAFDANLEQAIASLDQVKSKAEAADAKGEAKAASIQDEIDTSNNLFQEMMKAKQNLSRLYHTMHHNPEKPE
ncbi:MAG: hypothetical protein OEW12_02580 [Deltaproteobacteria bacterium]|nr:hypothetical protein [Deltaproteobacteria bacterium]